MIRRTLTAAALCVLPALAQAADIDAMLDRLAKPRQKSSRISTVSACRNTKTRSRT